MLRLIVLSIVVLMPACSTLPDHIALAEPTDSAVAEKMYVAATRLPDVVSATFQEDRIAKAGYARYTVSVPPTHKLGQIEWQRGHEADPATDFAVTRIDEFGSNRDFLSAIRAEPGAEVAVFVHGYNTTSSEALYRFTQVSHDYEIPFARVLFSWPSAGLAAGYVYDRDSVLFSRDNLAELLIQLSERTNKDITLIAHSMGSHLSMEVLRQLALSGRRDVLKRIDSVTLLAPDIDPDLFRAQANAVTPLPDPFVIMTNQDDQALSLSSFVNFGRQRVGDLAEPDDIAGLNITMFDFTALSDGSNLDHLVPMTSPLAIMVLRDLIRSERQGAVDLSNFDLGEDGVFRAKPPQG